MLKKLHTTLCLDPTSGHLVVKAGSKVLIPTILPTELGEHLTAFPLRLVTLGKTTNCAALTYTNPIL